MFYDHNRMPLKVNNRMKFGEFTYIYMKIYNILLKNKQAKESHHKGNQKVLSDELKKHSKY